MQSEQSIENNIYAVTKIHLWHVTYVNALKIYFHTKRNERKWFLHCDMRRSLTMNCINRLTRWQQPEDNWKKRRKQIPIYVNTMYVDLSIIVKFRVNPILCNLFIFASTLCISSKWLFKFISQIWLCKQTSRNKWQPRQKYDEQNHRDHWEYLYIRQRLLLLWSFFFDSFKIVKKSIDIFITHFEQVHTSVNGILRQSRDKSKQHT